ncbi:plasmid maintenance protein [Borreliella bissettiae]|uniref:plasmid maintenance protein n=1 Tax=Borrelia bissettiae TaxID=64897 RepID=UPI001E2846A1|nr:plasmid maintenance protein [Borreliella bissettiae]MCD2401698.1 plasmid maintenance protein [Borreliella bissettiae]
MISTISYNNNYCNKTKRLLSKNLRLKKIISIIIFLNKKFEESYNTSLHKMSFLNGTLCILIHHQQDILNILNSFIIKEGYKPTTIRTLREDLRFLIKIKAINKRILAFSNNIGQFKGKLCIYQTSRISYSIIDTYFSSIKLELSKKIKSNKEKLKSENVTENVTVCNKKLIKNNNKNSRNSLFEKVKKIVAHTKYPEKTLKNALLNYKDFNNYLKYDYQTKDIKEFYLKNLKKYRNKIHFMRQNANYETDFFKLVGEFKDTYINKWKINQNKTIPFDILANYKRKKI